MKKILLNGIWNLSGKREGAPEAEMLYLKGNVPGCVQLDLSSAGYLPTDLYMGENILETEKFEDYEWWYKTKFQAPKERENVYLVFEGVDCIAEYFLNGEKIGESKNMLISHEFKIDDYLIDGENMLTVHILSAVLAAHREEYSVFSMMAWCNGAVETGVRRAPHSNGWDIMPRAVTSGIWRDVKIEVRDKINFSQLYFFTDTIKATALYELNCDFSELRDVEIVLSGKCGESTFETKSKVGYRKAGRIDIKINNPKTWWPYGYGDANVYDVTAKIYYKGELIHEEETSFGLRTVKLDRTDLTDGKNGKFRFIINGVEVMCLGSNWVALDAFHSRDAERYDKALALVKDIGCNILRCWGGNVYEDHKFFDFLDRNGIMVWQDFSMACRIYPENEAYKKLIRDEATTVVRKLRNHPSIILWAGDNEVDEMVKGFSDPSLNTLTREVLPEVVHLNDFARPYLASSPYISGEAYKSTDKNLDCPEAHLWGPRDYYKSSYYKDSKAHFVSECGYHGCPSLESIKKFITPEKIWPYKNNSEWILHSCDQNGNDSRVMLMDKQVRQLFGTVPENPENYIIASQISQAEADKYFIERIRIGRPKKCGIIWWNLIDGWPEMSDAVVDYYFEKKLAYGYIKRAQAPFTIAAGEIASWNLPIYACNNALTEKRGNFKVIDTDTDKVIYEGSFTAQKNATTLIARLPVFYSEQKILIFRWEIDGKEGFNHYLCGFPPFSLEKYKTVMKKYGLSEV